MSSGRRRAATNGAIQDWAEQLQQSRAAAQANTEGHRHPEPRATRPNHPNHIQDALRYDWDWGQTREYRPRTEVFGEVQTGNYFAEQANRAQATAYAEAFRQQQTDRVRPTFNHARFREIVTEYRELNPGDPNPTTLVLTPRELGELRNSILHLLDPPNIIDTDDGYIIDDVAIEVIEPPEPLTVREVIDTIDETEPNPEETIFSEEWIRRNIEWSEREFDYGQRIGIAGEIRLRQSTRILREENNLEYREHMQNTIIQALTRQLNPIQSEIPPMIYNIDDTLRDFIFFLHKHTDTRYRDEADEKLNQFKDLIWPAS